MPDVILLVLVCASSITSTWSLSGSGEGAGANLPHSEDSGKVQEAASGTTTTSDLSYQALVRRPTTREEAVAQAELLQAALDRDRRETTHKLFEAWLHAYVGGAETQATDAFAFEQSMDAVIRHNLATRKGDSWTALNHLSATQRRRLRMTHRSKSPPCATKTPPAARSPLTASTKTPPATKTPLATKLPPPATTRMPPATKMPPVATAKPPVAADPTVLPSPPPSAPVFESAVLYTSGYQGVEVLVSLPAPAEVDWVKQGRTPPVRDQGSACASCWVHSALAAMESALAIRYNITPVAYSRQIIVDCANEYSLGPTYAGDKGCAFGDATHALLFMSQWTMPMESDYPYTSAVSNEPGDCPYDLLTLPATDKSWVRSQGPVGYPIRDEQRLKAAVALQPVVVYWVIGLSFSIYAQGVFTKAQQADPISGCSGDDFPPDHSMLLVGYSGNVWTLQNSYGTGWGEDGFMRVEMFGDPSGPCKMYEMVVSASLEFQRVPPLFVRLPEPPGPSPPSPSPPPTPLPPPPRPPRPPKVPRRPPLPPSPPTPAVRACRDSDPSDCEYWKYYGYCLSDWATMLGSPTQEGQCQASCGMCDNEGNYRCPDDPAECASILLMKMCHMTTACPCYCQGVTSPPPSPPRRPPQPPSPPSPPPSPPSPPEPPSPPPSPPSPPEPPGYPWQPGSPARLSPSPPPVALHVPPLPPSYPPEASPPSPPPPPPSPSPDACVFDDANLETCAAATETLPTFLQCGRNTTLRAACPCRCRDVGFCSGDYPFCSRQLTRSVSLDVFCTTSSYLGYALLCPCWCSQLTKPTLERSFDWRTMGRLTAVRDQGRCYKGDWALALMSAVEAAIGIAYSYWGSTGLSAQLLLDCANAQAAGSLYADDRGCEGGRAKDALTFMASHSILLETDYPFFRGQGGAWGGCNDAALHRAWNATDWVQLSGFWSAPLGNETLLMAAVSIQPVIVTTQDFPYARGVFTVYQQTNAGGCNASSGPVTWLLVGYNTLSVQRYWILQHCRGTNFGEQGLSVWR